MKPKLKVYFKFILILVIILSTIVAKSMGNTYAAAAQMHFKSFFVEMIIFLPLIFILIGLIDFWLPRSVVEPHIGKDSKIIGSFWIILLAMLQAGPLYGAFPVAAILWKKGASVRNIFIYLGAFSTLKIPMLTFETSFLGWKFSLLRTVITLPIFVLIALALEYFLKSSNFSVKEVKL